LRHCREIIRPSLFVAKGVGSWEDEGAKDLYERAVEKYRALKQQLQPQQLSDDVLKEMDNIVKHADSKLAGKHN